MQQISTAHEADKLASQCCCFKHRAFGPLGCMGSGREVFRTYKVLQNKGGSGCIHPGSADLEMSVLQIFYFIPLNKLGAKQKAKEGSKKKKRKDLNVTETGKPISFSNGLPCDPRERPAEISRPGSPREAAAYLQDYAKSGSSQTYHRGACLLTPGPSMIPPPGTVSSPRTASALTSPKSFLDHQLRYSKNL
jgi:hypothetical protein